MINVSNAFKAELNNDNRSFLPYLDIVLADGTVLETLDSSDIWDGGFKIDDGVTASGEFTIGSCITNKLTITLNNIYDKFSTYDFYMAKVTAYLGLELPDGTIEKIPKGEFTVDEPKYNGAVNILECLDNMYKLDSPYERVKTSYPATVGEIVRDICVACEVVLLTTVFEGNDIVINERPDDTGLSCRQVLSYAMQRICKFARCDTYGRLVVGWFEQQAFETVASLDGGSFDTDTPYSSGDTADGGSFAIWNTDDVADAGTFADQKRFHHLFSISSLNVSTDDVVITGVKVTEENNNIDIQEQAAYLYGKEGYVLAIAGNPFIGAGQAEEVATYIGEKLVGLRFRPMEGAFLEDPTLEAGDLLYVTDEKQNTYKCLITNLTFTLGNYMQVSCDAETPRKNSSYQYSELTKTMVKIRKQTKQQLSAYDKTVQNMTSLISKGFGMYLTPEEQEDGSVKWYMHDKPTIEESGYVLTNTSNGLMASLDGGTTWAVDKNGNALYNVLTVIGLNADWIKTGSLAGERINAKNLLVSDNEGNRTFYIDKNGNVTLRVSSFSLEGQSIEELIKKESNLLNENFVYSGTLTKGQSDPDGGTNAVKLIATGTDSFYSANASTNKPIKSTGQAYTFSVWLKASKATTIKISLNHTNGVLQDVDLTTSWKRYSISTTVEKITTANQVTIGGWGSFSTDNGAEIYIYDPVVVYGTETLSQQLTQEEVFNALTNNGKTQGIYMQNGNIFINATYIDTGSLAGWKINKTNQTLTSPNGMIVIDAKNEKISINGVELKGYGNGLIVSKGLAVECGTDEFSDGTDGFQIINLSTLSSGNYLRIVDNRVYQSPSSSKRYKEIGKNISGLDLEEWYKIQPVWAKYKEGYLDKRDSRDGVEYPMFIAENIKEHFPLAVDYNKDGLAENWNERVMIPAMFQMLKSQKNEIQSLKKELASIKQFLSLEGVS